MARQEGPAESPYWRGVQAGSVVLAVYDEPICVCLRSFIIPVDYQARLYDYVLATTRPHSDDDLAEQRRRSGTRLERLCDVYLMCDIEKARFTSERERLKRDLTLLEMRAQGQATHLEGLAKLLGHVAAAWAIVQPEHHYRLARLLFEEIVINDERVAAVKPRPELAGFFLLNHQEQAGISCTCCTGGPDGVPLGEYNMDIDSVLSDPQHVPMLPRHFPLIVSNTSAASARSHSCKYSRRRLSPEQRHAIVARASKESLRILAKEFGVSHETIRRVVDQTGARRGDISAKYMSNPQF